MADTFWTHALLPLQEATPGKEGWWRQLGQGMEAFLTVERVRDTIIVLFAAAVYLLISRRALDRMILAPSRWATAQELRAVRRAGVEDVDLDPVIAHLVTTSGMALMVQEGVLYRGLALRENLTHQAFAAELADVSAPALLSMAGGMKDSLRAPIGGLLAKETLTDDEALALREAMVQARAESAKKTYNDTRSCSAGSGRAGPWAWSACA